MGGETVSMAECKILEKFFNNLEDYIVCEKN